MTHHPDCERIGIKKVGSGKEGGYNYEGNVYNVEGFVPNNSPTANSNYGQEIIENWECVEDCPVKILDEQSGTLNQQGVCKTDNKSGWQNNFVGGGGVNAVERKLYLDKGGASRFFYIAKANKWERNYGLQEFENNKPMYESHRPNYENTKGIETPYAGAGRTGNENRNNHPTVKPIKLMQYLVRMITPPNGIVLDPFAGSGTTGIACKIDGFNFVGLELSEDYTKIANARIESFQEENVFVDETIIYKNRNKEEDENDDNNKGNGWVQLSLF
ncbi:MAG: site-specific DNA-methyltransferase [Planctomycetia bacterium]|nr:site-specific DNA-methyltransferase [Planctomycetia bacterium]